VIIAFVSTFIHLHGSHEVRMTLGLLRWECKTHNYFQCIVTCAENVSNILWLDGKLSESLLCMYICCVAVTKTCLDAEGGQLWDLH